MAQLKSTNVTGNLSVTGNTVASKFIKSSGTSDQLLKADGNTHSLSGITTAINTAQTTADNANASITAMQKDATITTFKGIEDKIDQLTTTDIGGIDDYATDKELLDAKTAILGEKDYAGTVKGAYVAANTAQTVAYTAKSKAEAAQSEIDTLEGVVSELTDTVTNNENDIEGKLTAEVNARREADNTKLSLNGNEMMTGSLSFASNALPEAEDATYTKIIIANSSSDKTTLGYRTTANFIQDLAIAQIYNFKGNLDDLNDLRAIASASVGDVYFISDTYHSWACKEKVTSATTESNYKTYWSDLGVIVNLRNYVTLDDSQEITGKKTFSNSNGLIITASQSTTQLTIKNNSIDSNAQLDLNVTNKKLVNVGSGGLSVGGTLGVTGTTTLKSDLQIRDSSDKDKFTVDTSGNTTISGITTLKSNLQILDSSGTTNKFTVNTSGDTTIEGTLGVAGITTLKSNLQIQDGDNENKFTVDTNGNTTIKGALYANGGIVVNTDKFIVDTSGNTIINGTLRVNATTKLNNTVSITSTGETSSIHINHNSIIARNNTDTSKEENLQLGNDSKKVHIGDDTIGNGTDTPIYLNGGMLASCNLYAGGTQVTLNGENLGSDEASFYAPTGAGNSGEILKSSGTGAPEWLSILPVANGGTGQSSLTSGCALIGNGTNAVSFRAIRNKTSIGGLGWTSATADTVLVTANTIAYWDGSFNGTASNLTKLGTVTTGTWNATTIAVNKGGTGLTSWTINRLIYASADTTLTTSNHYISNTKVAINSATAPTNNFYVNGNGEFNGTVKATSYYATSDVRLKQNFKQLITKQSILDLPIYIFDFIDGNKNQVGCIAQDLQKICPEIVTTDEKGYLSIQESKIVYLLIDEVKKLKEEIKQLKGENKNYGI